MIDIESFLEHYGLEPIEPISPTVMLYREVADYINRQIRVVNNKYAGENLVTDEKFRQKYNLEVVRMINERLLDLAIFRGFSFDSAQALTVSYNSEDNTYEFKSPPVGSTVLHAERDDKGFVLRLWLPSAYLSQSGETEEFLEHYGVKGMKWGKRKSTASPVQSSDAKTRDKIQSKANQSGTDALSNKQLQTAINRMNLEVNYARLNEQTRKKSMGEKMAQFLLKDVAEVEVKRVVKQQSTIAVDKAVKAQTEKRAANA